MSPTFTHEKLYAFIGGGYKDFKFNDFTDSVSTLLDGESAQKGMTLCSPRLYTLYKITNNLDGSVKRE